MTGALDTAVDPRFALLAAFVGLAYTAEAMTGFGSIVIALTLGALVYPIPELLPVLVPLNIVLTTTMVARHHAHVDRELLLRRIFPWMVPGLAVGFALFVAAPAEVLKRALGVFVVGVAGVELRRAMFGDGTPARPLGAARFAAATFSAGLIQGLVASGGPVLVYGMGRLGLPKSRFRATLAVIWLSLNTALLLSYLATGRFGAVEATRFVLLLPVVGAAFATGEWLHHRLDEATFRQVVLALLAVSGAALLV